MLRFRGSLISCVRILLFESFSFSHDSVTWFSLSCLRGKKKKKSVSYGKDYVEDAELTGKGQRVALQQRAEIPRRCSSSDVDTVPDFVALGVFVITESEIKQLRLDFLQHGSRSPFRPSSTL